MKKSFLLIVGVLLLSFTSCEYKFVDPIEVTITEPVSFSQQIEPVFQSKCVTCHSSRSPILTTGNAYNNLIDGNFINLEVPESSLIYEQLSGGHPGGNNAFSAEELALLLKWIQDGAENN